MREGLRAYRLRHQPDEEQEATQRAIACHARAQLTEAYKEVERDPGNAEARAKLEHLRFVYRRPRAQPQRSSLKAYAAAAAEFWQRK